MKRLLAGLLPALCAASAASAAVVVTMRDAPGGVVARARGTFDPAGLSGGFAGQVQPYVWAAAKVLLMNDPVRRFGMDLYQGAGTALPAFGGGGIVEPTAFSGTPFGFVREIVVVPQGYAAGSPIAATMTFGGQTLASMGLVAGRYVTTLPADTVTLLIGGTTAAVPEPAGWTLLIVGFGLVGAALRRRARGHSAPDNSAPDNSVYDHSASASRAPAAARPA